MDIKYLLKIIDWFGRRKFYITFAVWFAVSAIMIIASSSIFLISEAESRSMGGFLDISRHSFSLLCLVSLFINRRPEGDFAVK